MARRSEDILILGLGGVGCYLAERLSRGEHDPKRRGIAMYLSEVRIPIYEAAEHRLP